MQSISNNVFRYAGTVLRWIFEPLVVVEEKQCRRMRLLTVFLLLLAISSMLGAILQKNAGNVSWIPTAVATTFLLVGYGLSRTIYYRAAAILALIFPAFSSYATILLNANQVNIQAILMWLAIPLLISILVLPKLYTIISSISYTAITALLTFLTEIPSESILESMIFLVTITIFVIIITTIRQQDQAEIESELTERKRVEESLRESEERLRQMFESVSDGLTVADLEGNIEAVNNRLLEMHGFGSRDEILGKNALELIAPVDRERITAQNQKILEGDLVGSTEFTLLRTDGSSFVGELSMSVLKDTSGNPIGSVTTGRDVTDRKRAEDKLKKALSNLEQSSARLAATNKELEAFSYSVSHDLRSPLRSIDGFSQALLEDYSDNLDETGQDYLRRLRGASQKMGELIDGLLKLSRLTRSEMHKEKVDLSALAKEIADMLQGTQPERQADFTIGTGLTANGDRQLLRVLLENLLGNAWKFTGKTPQARIEFGITHNGNKKAYFVRDNGAGFDMTYVSKLFGAFQRLHDTSEFPGIGIGLATVQRIIHRHGGRVWAEGEAGKGATFYFTLN